MGGERTGMVAGTAGRPLYPSPWDHWADGKRHPEGGEPFGTKVTLWSDSWGSQRALITASPKIPGDRGQFDTEQWQIVMSSGGMTFVSAERLTLGWHPSLPA